MKCPRCQMDNRADARFCEECGARMEQSCPACGNPVGAGKKFCGHCGAALTQKTADRSAAPDRYTLTFQGGGRVNVRADCNRGSGAYEVNGNAMKLGPAALTKMGCPAGSQDTEFAAELGRAASYAIADNELVLTLADGGTMHFRAQR